MNGVEELAVSPTHDIQMTCHLFSLRARKHSNIQLPCYPIRVLHHHHRQHQPHFVWHTIHIYTIMIWLSALLWYRDSMMMSKITMCQGKRRQCTANVKYLLFCHPPSTSIATSEAPQHHPYALINHPTALVGFHTSAHHQLRAECFVSIQSTVPLLWTRRVWKWKKSEQIFFSYFMTTNPRLLLLPRVF